MRKRHERNEGTMKLLLHDKKFTHKPAGGEITPTDGVDKKGNTIYKENHILFNQVDMEAEAIAEALGTDGRTAVLGLFPMENGGFDKNKVIEQQLFFIDIDNGEKVDGVSIQVDAEDYMSFEEAHNMAFTQENALFMYHSFNSTEGWDRFRIAFALDVPVEENEEIDAVYRYLFNQYIKNGKTVADIKAKNSNRLFYGGKLGSTLVAPEARLHTYRVLKDAKRMKDNENVQNKPAKRVNRKDVTPVKVSPVTDMAHTKPTWQLLVERNFQEVGIRLAGYATTVSSRGQLEDYIRKQNMRHVLGIKATGGFHDIFHDEETPSASIYEGKTGTYFYKCHSSSAPFDGDIFKVVGALLKITYKKAIKLMAELMMIEVCVPNELKEIIEDYSLLQRQLLSEDLKTNFPQIHNRFWRYKLEVVAIIEIFKDGLEPDGNGGYRLISRISTRTLAEDLSINRSKVMKVLNLMTVTDILSKLSNSDIPQKLLNEMERERLKKGFSKRANAYELKQIDDEFIEELEEFCIAMKEKGMSIASTTTKSGLVASMGKEKAKQVFVQENNFNLGVKDREFVQDAIRLIQFSIENNDGWILQNEVKEGLQVKWKSPHTVDDKWKRLFPMIKRETKIERGRITNALRSKYSIDLAINSASTILYYND